MRKINHIRMEEQTGYDDFFDMEDITEEIEKIKIRVRSQKKSEFIWNGQDVIEGMDPWNAGIAVE